MSKRNPGGLISTTGLRKPSVTDQSQNSGVWTLEEQYQSEAKGTWANQSGQGYEIGRSLRFRQNGSTTLSRTPITASNRKTWTMSFWTKRGKLSYSNDLIGVYNGSNDNNNFEARFSGPTDRFMVVLWNYISETSAVFRDATAWYHVVLVLDTTQPGTTAGSKIKVFINGVLMPWLTDQVSSSMSQNADLGWNTTATHWIGRWQASDGGGYYYDGHMAEFNFIDGQALDASYFGYFDYNGVWQPKKYVGDYGVNGFYLPFKDNTNLAGLGADRKPTSTIQWQADGALTTSVSKFSGSSYNMASNLQEGTGYGISRAVHNIYNKDFTIEFWYRGQVSDTNFGSQDGVLSGYNYLVGKGRVNTAGYGWGVHLYNSGAIGWTEFYGSGGAGITSSGHNVLDNNWHHIAITKSGSTVRIFIDGTQRGSGTINNNTDNNYGLNINGMWDYTNGNYITYKCGGAMDDFRMYTGIAKYTANFTAPTQALPIGEDDPYWGYVSAALPMDGKNGDKKINAWTQNVWTTNNFSLTAGITYDSMADSPTNGSSTEDNRLGGQAIGNYATLSPYVRHSGTVDNGNLRFVASASTPAVPVSTIGVTSGKWYMEFTHTGSENYPVGIVADNRERIYMGASDSSTSVSFWCSPSVGSTVIYINGVGISTVTGTPWANGDTIGLALDADNKIVYCYRNGTLVHQYNYSALQWTETYFACGNYISGQVYHANFGQRPFAYTAPSGYKCLCTTNLPVSAIPNGKKEFDILVWSGEGSGRREHRGLQFKPDLNITKARNTTYGLLTVDSVRGLGPLKEMTTNTTGAEGVGNTNVYDYITQFNSDGFTSLWSGSNFPAYYNESGKEYVSWNWRAGDSTVTNTAGSITSQVRANQTAGFSILTYTGTGSTATVGHGLGRAPGFIIVKKRNSSDPWVIFHKDFGIQSYFLLNASDAMYTNLPNYWSSTNPSSTTFGLGPGYGGNNSNGANYVAYCFAEIPGYSRIGYYLGNGSSDGSFVYTGLKPSFVLIKQTNAVEDWAILDSTRQKINPVDFEIFTNQSATEYDGNRFIDFLSNGFKFRSAGGNMNANGNIYMYIAFAENPFTLARAR